MANGESGEKSSAVRGSRERNIVRAWLKVATGMNPDSTGYARGILEGASYDPIDDRVTLTLAGARVMLRCCDHPMANETLLAFGLPLL
jgi:hypothetical protein